MFVSQKCSRSIGRKGRRGPTWPTPPSDMRPLTLLLLLLGLGLFSEMSSALELPQRNSGRKVCVVTTDFIQEFAVCIGLFLATLAPSSLVPHARSSQEGSDIERRPVGRGYNCFGPPANYMREGRAGNKIGGGCPISLQESLNYPGDIF